MKSSIIPKNSFVLPLCSYTLLPPLGSVHHNFVFSRVSYKWNQTACNPLRLAAFTQCKDSESHPRCCMYQYHSFLLLKCILLYGCTSWFIHSTTQEYLGCSQFLSCLKIFKNMLKILWQNTQNIKLIIFTLHSSAVLSTFILLRNHHHHPSPNLFSSCKTETLYPLNNNARLIPPIVYKFLCKQKP